MKKSNKIILGIVTIVGISMVAISGTTKHYSGHGFNGKKATFITERISHELALTAPQEKQLNTIKVLLLSKVKSMQADKTAHKSKVQNLFTGSTLDRNAALQMVTEKTSTIQTQAPEIIHAIADFYDALNPDQQAKVQTLITEKMNRGHHGRFTRFSH